MDKAEINDVKARLLDLAKDAESHFSEDGDDEVFRDDCSMLHRAVELLDGMTENNNNLLTMILSGDEDDPPLIARIWLDRASEILQAAGFEDASKYIDCAYDL